MQGDREEGPCSPLPGPTGGLAQPCCPPYTPQKEEAWIELLAEARAALGLAVPSTGVLVGREAGAAGVGLRPWIVWRAQAQSLLCRGRPRMDGALAKEPGGRQPHPPQDLLMAVRSKNCRLTVRPNCHSKTMCSQMSPLPVPHVSTSARHSHSHPGASHYVTHTNPQATNVHSWHPYENNSTNPKPQTHTSPLSLHTPNHTHPWPWPEPVLRASSNTRLGGGYHWRQRRKGPSPAGASRAPAPEAPPGLQAPRQLPKILALLLPCLSPYQPCSPADTASSYQPTVPESGDPT